jgi:hypothetical protein
MVDARTIGYREKRGLNMIQSIARIVTAFVVSSAVLFSSAAKANDTTIPCNAPPDKGASVAVHSGTQVSLTQDHQKGTCTFAINGAVATSPSPQQVISALNLFRGQSLGVLRDSGTAANAIAALMAASSPADKVPDDLVSALKRPTLLNCLKTFFAERQLPPGNPGESGFLCRGVAPYTNESSKHDMLTRSGLAPGEPMLEVAVKWQRERFTSKAYFPLSMLTQQPRR